MKFDRHVLRAWWRKRRPGQRNAMKLLGVLLCLIALAEAGRWLRAERLRLPEALAVAEARSHRIQNELTEIQGLRGKKTEAPLQGPALVSAISASLQSRQLPLVVMPMDSQSVRIEGVSGFDETVAWLATAHRDHKLRLVKLVVSRQAGAARFDAILSSANR